MMMGLKILIFLLRSTTFYILLLILGVVFFVWAMVFTPEKLSLPWLAGLVGYLAICLFIAFGLYDFRIRYSNQLINQYGVLSSGKIDQIRTIGTNDGATFLAYHYRFQIEGQKPVVGYFRTIQGQKLETTSASLTYPGHLFLSYPRVDEEFELKYIPSQTKYFVILNTGESEFAQAIQEEHKQKRVRQLEHREERAKRMFDLDPNNQERLKIYQQAQQDLYDYWQFGTKPKLKEKIDGTLFL